MPGMYDPPTPTPRQRRAYARKDMSRGPRARLAAALRGTGLVLLVLGLVALSAWLELESQGPSEAELQLIQIQQRLGELRYEPIDVTRLTPPRPLQTAELIAPPVPPAQAPTPRPRKTLQTAELIAR
jgi:hypothetical protein